MKYDNARKTDKILWEEAFSLIRVSFQVIE